MVPQYKDLLEQGYFTYRGRVALTLLLKALDVGPGDEVIIQAFTCEAVPEAVLATGARPVYADIDPETFSSSLPTISNKLSPRTKAIVVQYTFGIVREAELIASFCADKHIPLIEDCCHITYLDHTPTKVGTLGAGSFYSFEWGKPVVAGIGGALLINNQQLRMRINSLYRDLETPSLNFRARLEYLAFNLTNFQSLRFLVKRLYQLATRLGILRGNFNREPGISEDFKLKMTPFNRQIVERKLSSPQRKEAIGIDVNKEWLTRWLPGALKIPQPTLLRLPLFFRSKKRALELAMRMGLDASGWYLSPIHPITDAGGLAAWGYTDSCPIAERAAETVVHFKVPQGDREWKKLRKLVVAAESQELLIPPISQA